MTVITIHGKPVMRKSSTKRWTCTLKMDVNGKRMPMFFGSGSTPEAAYSKLMIRLDVLTQRSIQAETVRLEKQILSKVSPEIEQLSRQVALYRQEVAEKVAINTRLMATNELAGRELMRLRGQALEYSGVTSAGKM